MKRTLVQSAAGLDLLTLAALTFALMIWPRCAQATTTLPLPTDLTIEGRLYDAGGRPITSTTDFKFELVDENNTSCVLFSELHPGVDLSSASLPTPDPSADGIFSLRLGAGTTVFAGADFATIFAPGRINGDNCFIDAAAGAHRLVRVSVSPNGGNAYEALAPDVRVTAVPVALLAGNAMAVQGVGTSGLLVLNGSTSLKQINFDYLFSDGNYPKLRALVDGTSGNYLGTNLTADVPFGNQKLIDLRDPTLPQDAATKNYADANLAGQAVDVSAVGLMRGNLSVMQWDATNTKWVAGPASSSPTGTAGGALTGSYPNPALDPNAMTTALITRNTTTQPNRLLLTDSNLGATVTVGECAINQVYAWTVTGWACTDASRLSAVTSVATRTGAVTLTALDIGGLGTAAVRDVGTAAGQVVALDAAQRLPTLDGSALFNLNAIKLQGNPVSPVAPGTGQVLAWGGSAWQPSSATSGTVTSVATGTGLSGGPITSTGTINVNVGTNANQLVQLDGSAQLPMINGSLLQQINAVALQGRALAPISPTDQQVLTWNASLTAWAPQTAAPTGVTTVNTGTGLTGGPITTSGTINVNVGTGAGQIPQLSANAQMKLVYGTPAAPTYSFAMDATAGLTHVGTSGLALVSAGTQRLVVADNGNVGIGTNLPRAALDVFGIGTTASALVVPRDSGANRPLGTNGMLRYNTDVQRLETYQNGFWTNVVTSTSGTGPAPVGQVQFGTASGLGGSSSFTYGDAGGLTLATPLTVNNSAVVSGGITASGTSSVATLNVGGNATFNKVVAQGVVTNVGPNCTLDFGSSNLFKTPNACQPFTLANVVSGASYTVVVYESGTSSISFSAGGANVYYMPANDVRTANTISVYNLLVVGSDIFVTWSSGFQ